MARLNTGLVALVDRLGRAESGAEVARLQRSGREQVAALGGVLQRLQAQRFEPEVTAEAGRTLQAIAANLEAQAAAIERLLGLRQQQQAQLAEQRRALTALGGLAESLAANASTATSTTIASLYPLVQRGADRERVLDALDRLAEVDIDRIERMSELQLLCFNLKTQLERLEREDDAAALDPLRRHYGEQLGVMQRRLQDVRDPQRRADALGQHALLQRSLAPAGLFAVRAENLALGQRLAALRAEGAAQGLRLGEQGARLLEASRRSIQGATDASRHAVDRGMAGFLAVAALLFAGLMLSLWLILRSHLVGRLQEMEGLVRALGRGDLDVAIRPRDARDPLAPLAQALEQFRRNARERLRLEQALREHQQALEQQVQARTAELTRSNQLLAHEVAEHAVARRQAEEANRAKNEFLGTLSHELRTPLAGVDGSVQLLRDTRLDARQQEYLRMIGYANSTLLEILDDMLSFSRLEGGRVGLEREPFDLRETVDDMLALQWVSAQAKGVALVRDIAEDLPQRLVGDRRKLNQLLLNTIGNAVKFTDEGEIAVVVRRIPGEAPDAAPDRLTLRFEVRDSGIGIPADQQEAVFAPFVQVEDTTHRRHGGTGLGLAVCRRLVTLMGGRIGLNSVLGQGTTVHFELPFELAPPADAEAAVAAAAAATAPAAVQRVLDVLVVEDDEVNRTVCLRHLEFLGHRPRAVGDGEAVLALLRHGDVPVDLVLMDISLPGASGIEVTQAIRRLDDGRLQALPIVAMSAHLPEGAREDMARAGMAGFLPKPFDRARLARTLAQAMAAALAAPAVTAVTAAPAPQVPALPAAVAALPAAGDGEALLDEAFLAEELVSLGRATVERLLALFLAGAEEAFETFAQALAAGDREALARRAHKLASAASNL
ncbi:MAG TPA: ATP-binding protein, partial [Burkholderiaceae bacterium]|nr:ATP-binding protein [Burkholderiaceae bacterium]